MPLSADVLLPSLEYMRTSDIWAPVMASLSETHWHGINTPPGQVSPRQFTRLLADALASKGQDPSCNILSPAVVRRLQACFGKLVSPQTFEVLHNYSS